MDELVSAPDYHTCEFRGLDGKGCLPSGHRPLPSGRLTSAQAQQLLLAIVPLDMLLSAYLEVADVAAAALILNWMYNDLGGADTHYIVRNLINALAFTVGCAGTTMVALGNSMHRLNTTAYHWLAMEGAIVLTTLQVQDLRDQEGDKVRGRSTVPVTLGDPTARWTVAVPVPVWSLACPAFWSVGPPGYIAPLALGAFLAARVLLLKDVEADKLT